VGGVGVPDASQVIVAVGGTAEGAADDEPVVGFGDAAEEEGRRPRVFADPGMPSRQDVIEHNVTHMPYRSWCARCVRGRGRNNPHRTTSIKISNAGVPVITGDYGFLITKDGDHVGDLKLGPMLVLKDCKHGGLELWLHLRRELKSHGWPGAARPG
jgi:hypothetical protein